MNEKLILVGGSCEESKTQLIDALIRIHPDIYARLISSTTRNRCTDDGDHESILTTELEFYDLHTESMEEIIHAGKIPLVEIHPKNHLKINNKLNGGAMSVLIKTSHTLKDDIRASEDNQYCKGMSDDNFDIIFCYDVNKSPENNAKYFHMKLSVVSTFQQIFPPSGEIDSTTRSGYNKVAEYFTEEKRITTRNFHELSVDFFKEMFEKYVEKGKRVLEVGTGRGWLSKTVFPKSEEYISLDISDKMTENNPCKNKVTASARCINSAIEEYDVVVASLADPYFYPEALCEIARVLKSGGHFIFSLPSHEWANAQRIGGNNNKNVFTLDSGEMVEIYSFTFSKETLNELMKSCGFRSVKVVSENGSKLFGKEISTSIIQAAENVGKSINELEIVTMAVFQKV